MSRTLAPPALGAELASGEDTADGAAGGIHYLESELYALVQKDRSIFDFLAEGTLDGLWYWDLEAPEHEWLSPGFWELLGFAPENQETSGE